MSYSAGKEGLSVEAKRLVAACWRPPKKCRNPNCANATTSTDWKQGIRKCDQCGAIIEEGMVSSEAEWRVFADDEGESAMKVRVGQRENSRTSMLSDETTIEGGRLARLHADLSMNPKEKLLSSAHAQARRLQTHMSLNLKTHNKTLDVLNLLHQADALKSTNVDGMVAAAVYNACKLDDVGLSQKDILANTHVKRKRFNKCYKIIHSLKIFKKLRTRTKRRQAREVKMIGRYYSNLNLSYTVASTAQAIAQKASDIGISEGKNPATFAAASLYMAAILCKDSRTYLEISQVSDTKPSTIRNAYEALYKHRSQVVDHTNDMSLLPSR